MQLDLSRAQNGILLVDKPAGWTSFDVVAKIRGQLRAECAARGEKPTKRQLKVGHAGTLDPFATGLLVILLGEATKNADEFLKLDKVYEATIRLGATSTTGDPEGEIKPTTPQKPLSQGTSLLKVEAAIDGFVGEVQQQPPVFSAIKIGGQRAYKLARKGQMVDMPLRTVTIHSIEIIDYTWPDLKIRTHVSSGTYIRTLAEDIGTALGTGAYCAELRRVRIDSYSVEDASTLE